MKYLQWLQNKIIVKDATLLEGTEGLQVVESKCRKSPPENNMNYWLSKKTKRKQPARYQGDMEIKLGGANSCERCVHAMQDCLVYNSR